VQLGQTLGELLAVVVGVGVLDLQADLGGAGLDGLLVAGALGPAAGAASGGIAPLDDLVALRRLVPLGLEGAIVGKALYNGNFTLQEALAVAGDEDKRQPSKARS